MNAIDLVRSELDKGYTTVTVPGAVLLELCLAAPIDAFTGALIPLCQAASDRGRNMQIVREHAQRLLAAQPKETS